MTRERSHECPRCNRERHECGCQDHADVEALIAERDDAKARATAFFEEHSRIVAERDALRGEVLYLREVLEWFAHEAQLALDHRRGGVRAGTPRWVQVPPSVCASIITEVEHTRDPENVAYCGREITASLRRVEAERDRLKEQADHA